MSPNAMPPCPSSLSRRCLPCCYIGVDARGKPTYFRPAPARATRSVTLSPPRRERVTEFATRLVPCCPRPSRGDGALAIARGRGHNGGHEPLRAAEIDPRCEPQTGLPGGVLPVGGKIRRGLRSGAARARGAHQARRARALRHGRARPAAAAVHAVT